MTLFEMRLVVHSFLSSFQKSAPCREEETYLTSEEMPKVLKEPHILTGYRQLGKPWTYYIQSFCSLHNESINVWTHALGFVLLLLQLVLYFRGQDVIHDKLAWPVLGFGICSLFNLICSATAHLLHSKSRWHHYVFYYIDYMGVSFYSFGTGVGSMFICSTKTYHDFIHRWFLPANVLFSWFAFFAMCVAKIRLSHDNTKRKALMVAGVALQGVYISLPTLSRYVECLNLPECTLASLNHLTLVFALICSCAITYAGHAPECFFPGRFDIFGHGHQIFHVLVVMAMSAQIRALDIDANLLLNADPLEPNLRDILLSFAVLFVLDALTLLYYMQFIVFRRLSEDTDHHHLQHCGHLLQDESDDLDDGTAIQESAEDVRSLDAPAGDHAKEDIPGNMILSSVSTNNYCKSTSGLSRRVGVASTESQDNLDIEEKPLSKNELEEKKFR